MSTDVQHSDEEDAPKKRSMVAVKQLDNIRADIVQEVQQQTIHGIEAAITRFCQPMYSRR